MEIAPHGLARRVAALERDYLGLVDARVPSGLPRSRTALDGPVTGNLAQRNRRIPQRYERRPT